MTEQTNLGDVEIGTKEPERTKLEPGKVKIVSWEKQRIEKAHADKIQFAIKHPDKEEPVTISAVSYLDGKSVTTSGTWVNMDDENKLQKGTALTTLLNRLGANTLNETVGKEIDTELDDRGYLVFKAY